MYIGQFPNEKVTIVARYITALLVLQFCADLSPSCRFVAFIAGSFAAVLVLASVVDPDLFLHFEITPHRTVLFYITVFGSILAVARGMIPEDNHVFDPELLMSEVVQYTHYMPDEWKGELHSKHVHEEFGQLFAMKVMTFIQELLSVILTPFVLWYSLPPCAPAIVDFFREFSVHVDELGYVCSFAVFDFQRHGNVKVRFHPWRSLPFSSQLTLSQQQFGAPGKAIDEHWQSKEGKMEKSFLNFKAAHPDWTPADPTSSLYLSRIADLSSAHPMGLGRRRFLHHHRPIVPIGMAGDANMESTVQLHPPGQDYDRALRASQSVMRRRGGGLGTGSVLHPAQLRPVASDSVMFQSHMGPPAIAQTAVLGDSQGSVAPPEPIPEDEDEDIVADGGVGSTLGESYVDGRRARPGVAQSQQEEDEERELEDGGVLGLLAQIYGAGANVKGRGRGPPRAI